MSGHHYLDLCRHGVVHESCRCPFPNKTTNLVPCGKPCADAFADPKPDPGSPAAQAGACLDCEARASLNVKMLAVIEVLGSIISTHTELTPEKLQELTNEMLRPYGYTTYIATRH